jgi:hypothetical protein
LLIAIAVILALPVSAYFVLQNSRIQTFLTKYFTEKISEQLNAKVSIGYVNFTFFNQLLLKDVYIEDQAGDTLLFTPRLSVGIKKLNTGQKEIVFSKIYLREASVNLKQDADKVMNLQFIIDALASPDTTKAKWDLNLESVELKNSFISFVQAEKTEKEYGVNFRDIEISGLDLLLRRVRFEKDTVLFQLRYIGFTEKSGFKLDHISAETSISPSHIKLNNLDIETRASKLSLDHLIFSFRDFKAFRDFINRVSLDASFRQSDLHFEDIAYFAPALQNFYKNIQLKGNIKGRVNNFKGDNLEVRFSDETFFTTNLNFIGLPDIKETFIFLDLINFTTTTSDIENIQVPGVPDLKISLPNQIKNAGKIDYYGKFTGFLEDFVAYGNLSSDLGNISTDLLLKPDENNQIHFEGRIKTDDFKIGNLLEAEEIGRISLNAEVEGNFSKEKGIEALLEGTIHSFEILDYNYQQINLSGELAENKFDGTISVSDPNINFQFLGRVDFSEEMPQFDFSAYASKAQLYHLNIDPSDSTNSVNFLVTANFIGNHPDNLDGNIRVLDLDYRKNGKSLLIEDLSLTAEEFNGARKIHLVSNFLDAEISGKYEFATLGNSFTFFISRFLPAFSLNGNVENYESKNNFIFNMHFKNTLHISDFFTPWLRVSEDATLSGIYSPENLQFSITGSIQELQIINHLFKDFTINSSTTDSIFRLYSISKEAKLFDSYLLGNFELNSIAFDNNVDFEFNWDDKNVIKNRGEFLAGIHFEKINGNRKPLIDIQIAPSRIFIADSLWNVSQSTIRIDSSAISVGDFLFKSQSQMINLYGKVSEDPYDSLFLSIENIDLDQFNLLSLTKQFDIKGIVDGKAKISNIYQIPYIESDITIDRLNINEEPFGNMTIHSSWNYGNKSIFMNAFTERGTDRLLSFSGNFLPESKEIDFNVRINKFNVRIFDGFLDVVFRDIRGIASGEATLKGTLNKPFVNGRVSLQKASLLIDFLNTRYSFTHAVDIINNNIVFNNLRLTDSGNNTAVLNGTLKNNYFKDFHIDLSINARNFLSLNTTERDNELFYGRVFSTGIVKISGTPQNISMDISAKTEKNTEFYIPLTASSEIGEINFLTFVGSEKDIETPQRTYEVDLSGILLNFDLEVTPDAEIQIIFDSKIGDVIRGRGSGNLKMEINTQGSFSMFGEYLIDQGDYLFTLQNVINKRFEVQRGGRITWNGDPYNADVELLAIYRVRVPLSGLFFDESEQYTRRLPVECQIQMRDKLLTPDLVFNIDVPTADADTRRKLQGTLNTEEKINRQFLSLLIINNFLPEQDFFAGLSTGNTIGLGATTAGVTTASEFFSNQLSNWLSQLSKEVDIGVVYRPGDEVSPEELELALSTQVFNDRVRINGNVDVTGRETTTSNIVGDFDVDIKLNRSGKVRLKAFTRANDNLRYQISPYTQGIGLFYREEFDTFTELMRKYWRTITFQKDEKTTDNEGKVTDNHLP